MSSTTTPPTPPTPPVHNPPPTQQVVMAPASPNEEQVKVNGYGEFLVTWPVPFADTNYAINFSHAHRSIGTETGKNAYVHCGWRDKKAGSFLAVIGIHPELGAKAGDLLEIDATGIHL